MPSLYHRLFTYRERENRSPLEDFLTEALADLLNRLPEVEARGAVSCLLSQRPDALEALDRVWPLGATAQWTTQRPIAGGRIIDLLMEVGGRPVLVVENKVGAGFQEHSVEALGENRRQHQLATYGQWVAKEADVDWGGALVLLTHWTPAPANFASDARTFASRYRTAVRWSDFSRWLALIGRSLDQRATDWAKLAEELVAFLKEQKMDSELATSQDLAALQIYIASADRVRNAVERIWEAAKSTWRPICQQASVPLEISTEYGCAWKYRYLARQDLRAGYLAVGIRCPTPGGYLSDIVADDAPYLFVELSGDDIYPEIDRLAMPPTWLSCPGLWLAKRSLRDLPSDADLLVAEGEAWVRERIGEAASALT